MSDKLKTKAPISQRLVPPNDLTAEVGVLGGIILRNEAIDLVRDLLSPEDFYYPVHQRIFSAMTDLFDAQEPIDLVTLKNHLNTKESLETCGGVAYLNKLLGQVITTANIEHYARLINSKAVLRKLINASFEIQELAQTETLNNEVLNIGEVVNHAQEKILSIDVKDLQTPYESMDGIITETLKIVDERQTAIGYIGEETGFRDLDEKTNGLRKGNLVLIAGRPSMGKTSLAISIAQTIAEKKHVLFFSVEMGQSQLGMRMLCLNARVNLMGVLKGTVTDMEMQRLADAAGLIISLDKLHFSFDTSETIGTIRAKARRLKREKGELGAVIIDYLQLLSSLKKYETREREISDYSRMMKLMAKELDCPVVALCQLNREVEHRGDKKPRLSDLRESGSMEQDADLVLFVYRDFVYNKGADPCEAEIIIGKQRDGPIGTVKMAFLSEYARFEAFSGEGY